MSKVKIVYGNAEILEAHYLEATHFSMEAVGSALASVADSMHLYVTEDVQIPAKWLLFCPNFTILTHGDRADTFEMIS